VSGFLGFTVVSATRKDTTADMLITRATHSIVKDNSDAISGEIQARLDITDIPHIMAATINATIGGGNFSSIVYSLFFSGEKIKKGKNPAHAYTERMKRGITISVSCSGIQH